MISLKRHPLIVFFILAFVFPWQVWGTTIAQSERASLFSYSPIPCILHWPEFSNLYHRGLNWRAISRQGSTQPNCTLARTFDLVFSSPGVDRYAKFGCYRHSPGPWRRTSGRDTPVTS